MAFLYLGIVFDVAQIFIFILFYNNDHNNNCRDSSITSGLPVENSMIITKILFLLNN